MTEDQTAVPVLQSSWDEQAELDSLLVKLTTGSLAFSVGLGALDEGSPLLMSSWVFFLPSVAAILASKFVAIEALRADYQGRTHGDRNFRKQQRERAKKLDRVVQATNYAAGLLFLAGSGFVVAHMWSVV